MDLGLKKRASQNKRGPDAYGRLLEAGIDVFGQHGFSDATTRMIAEAARVNIAAIPYLSQSVAVSIVAIFHGFMFFSPPLARQTKK